MTEGQPSKNTQGKYKGGVVKGQVKFMGKKSNFAKEERIKAEVRRLSSLYKNLGKDTKKVVKSLIENAAFMSVTLEDLQDHINKNGVTSEYQNGENQWGTKKSPEVDVHIAMTKNHTAIMKQLTDLLPKEPSKEKDDGFDAFVNGRDDV